MVLSSRLFSRQGNGLKLAAQDYEITFDGGSLGNPGKGYGSYLIASQDGVEDVVRLEFSENGEIVTSNQAEYRTLIAALEELTERTQPATGSISVKVYGDSQLVIEQLAGRWKVRNAALRPLHAKGTYLISKFKNVQLIWHRRNNSVDVLGH